MWLRYCKLTVQTSENNSENLEEIAALDLSQFRIRFEVTQRTNQRPSTAIITVYNISPDTAARINVKLNELDSKKQLKVVLEAGYEEDHGILFIGDLWWKSLGRENGTDTFMRLIAATGDRAHQFALSCFTLAKGMTQRDLLQRIAESLEKYGVPNVYAPDILMTGGLPRGKVVFKMSRDALGDFANTNGLQWGYSNQGVEMMTVDRTKDRPEGETPVIVLNAATGLIGRPELTPNGVEIQALLNPKIQIGTIVQIDNRSIQRGNIDTSYAADVQKNLEMSDAMLDADGLYRVVGRSYRGDTRGDDWYTFLQCIALEGAPTTSQTPYNNIAGW